MLCIITGFIYPGIVTRITQAVFPSQANGSLELVNGRVVGSALIGQPFTHAEYFHTRPSAAGAGYDSVASAGTNKGPTDRKLADTLFAQRVASAATNIAISSIFPLPRAASSAPSAAPTNR